MIEGIDYIFNENGMLVFTAKYLQERGFCCGNGCVNCPFDYQNVHEPLRTHLLQKRREAENDA
jgi:hypothetical protein